MIDCILFSRKTLKDTYNKYQYCSQKKRNDLIDKQFLISMLLFNKLCLLSVSTRRYTRIVPKKIIGLFFEYTEVFDLIQKGN